ncbi:MAG: hypothetical protein ABSB41_11100 [Anaerolineales bacterium]|jgi:hypothetical protein
MLWIVGALFPALTNRAAFYLDPGSGSFLIQLLIAAIAGAGIVIASQWSRIKRMFGKKKTNVSEAEDEDDEQKPDA